MSPEEQRIAIAEACGWQDLREEMAYVDWVASRELWGCRREDDDMRKEVPDYPNDLNAMHEAVEKLTTRQKLAYAEHLMDACRAYPVGGVPDWHHDRKGLTAVSQATAAQRAEAFLKTLNLWED